MLRWALCQSFIVSIEPSQRVKLASSHQSARCRMATRWAPAVRKAFMLARSCHAVTVQKVVYRSARTRMPRKPGALRACNPDRKVYHRNGTRKRRDASRTRVRLISIVASSGEPTGRTWNMISARFRIARSRRLRKMLRLPGQWVGRNVFRAWAGRIHGLFPAVPPGGWSACQLRERAPRTMTTEADATGDRRNARLFEAFVGHDDRRPGPDQGQEDWLAGYEPWNHVRAQAVIAEHVDLEGVAPPALLGCVCAAESGRRRWARA